MGGSLRVRRAVIWRNRVDRLWSGRYYKAKRSNKLAYRLSIKARNGWFRMRRASKVALLRFNRARLAYIRANRILSARYRTRNYWLKKARHAHHKLASYVQAGAHRGYLH